MSGQLINKLFSTDEKSYTLLFLRVIAAVIILPHGAQKLLGWFGGNGFQATVSSFSNYLGIPPVFGVLAILTESIGALFLLFGLFSRISAFALAVTMVVAVFTVHIHNGLFMNWGGTAAGEGYEYHILYFAIAFVVFVKGAGAFALDTVLLRKVLSGKSEGYGKEELQTSN
ncbi:MAG: DoxX family protein [Bacillota bacterium]